MGVDVRRPVEPRVATNEQLSSEVQEQAKLLLDTHLSNLGQRLFEVGKRADQQLTAWLTFAALTVALCFGVTGKVSLGGLELTPVVAAAVTYVLSCAFYYRAVLSMRALGLWRKSLKERRTLRFGALLGLAKGQGPEVEKSALLDVTGGISEYPGYLACSVLIKEEAKKQGRVSSTLIQIVHKGIIAVFTTSTYLLAGALLYRSGFVATYVVVALLGIAVCLAANLIVNLPDDA